MKLGTPTNVPGLYQDGVAWNLRVKLKVSGVTTERRKRVEGSKSDALEALARLRREAEAECVRVANGATRLPTVGDFAPQWLKALAQRRGAVVKPAFFETRTHYLERFILPFFGNLEPKAIKPSTIEAWKDWLAEQQQRATAGKGRANPRAGQSYAKDTLQSAWSTFRAFLGWVCVRTDLPNPMRDLRFDVGGKPRVAKAVLSQAELARLLDAALAESPDIRAMMVVGFATGMRFAELSALEWRDIDLVRGTLRIERSQVGGHVGPPKTESTRRLVYLPPEIIEVLTLHQRSRVAAGPGVSPDVVFPSQRGTYRFPQVLKAPLERCCARAGINKHLTAHCMRKTANNLIRQAAGDVVARAMVGQVTTEMTFRYSEVDAAERGTAHRVAFGDVFKAAPPMGSEN